MTELLVVIVLYLCNVGSKCLTALAVGKLRGTSTLSGRDRRYISSVARTLSSKQRSRGYRGLP